MSQGTVERNCKQIDEALARLDDVRAKVVSLLCGLTQAQADRRPSENEWSIGEIADHLALTERAYVGGVAELAETAQPHEFAYEEVLRQRKYRVEDLGDVAVTGKFPTPPHLLPTRGKDLADLLRGLEGARSETRRLLAPFRDKDLSVKFFRHPLLGPMTLYERLANIAYHEQKHVGQMERILAPLACRAARASVAPN
jgi:uncharacterized damage-inducible protein DinB